MVIVHLGQHKKFCLSKKEQTSECGKLMLLLEKKIAPHKINLMKIGFGKFVLPI